MQKAVRATKVTYLLVCYVLSFYLMATDWGAVSKVSKVSKVNTVSQVSGVWACVIFNCRNK